MYTLAGAHSTLVLCREPDIKCAGYMMIDLIPTDKQTYGVEAPCHTQAVDKDSTTALARPQVIDSSDFTPASLDEPRKIEKFSDQEAHQVSSMIWYVSRDILTTLEASKKY